MAVAAGAINVAMVAVAVVGMRMRTSRRSAVKRFKSLTRLLHSLLHASYTASYTPLTRLLHASYQDASYTALTGKTIQERIADAKRYFLEREHMPYRNAVRIGEYNEALEQGE